MILCFAFHTNHTQKEGTICPSFWVSLVFLAEESGEQGFVLGSLFGDAVTIVDGCDAQELRVLLV